MSLKLAIVVTFNSIFKATCYANPIQSKYCEVKAMRKRISRG